MKKRSLVWLLCCFSMIFSLFTFSVNVNAEDLSNELTLSNALGNSIQFQVSYDKVNDVTNVHTILYVSDESIDKILAQKPGVGGNLGVFYVGVRPNKYNNMPEHKQVNYYYASGTDVATVKADLEKRIANKAVDTSGDPSTWVYGVAIQYKNGTDWNTISDPGTGTISIGDNLAKLVGEPLVYGENYRFFMYEDLDWYIQYQGAGTNKDIGPDYVKVSYEIQFPVAAKLEDGRIASYPSIELALQSGSNDITVNSDITVSKDLEIMRGTTITVAKGATLNVATSATIKNYGAIVGNVNGKVINYYSVNFDEVGKGANVVVAEGEKVTSYTPKRDGYRFLGWFETGAKEPFDFTKPITKNVDLLAKWEIIPGESEIIAPVIDTSTPVKEVIVGVITEKETVSMLLDSADEVTKQKIETAIANGKDIKTQVVVKPIDLTSVDNTVKNDIAEIEKNANSEDLNIVQYLDLSIIVSDDDQLLGTITEINDPLTFQVAIPESLKKEGRVFQVVRVHNGVVTVLPTVEKDGVLIFETNQFSTYALVYKDGSKKNNSVATGDVTSVSWYVSLCGIAFFMAGSLAIKRKFNK